MKPIKRSTMEFVFHSSVATWIIAVVCCGVARGQQEHDHAGSAAAKVAPPKVFLDKSPRIVEYQLSRLSNEQLLLIETKTDDPLYLPVFNAILAREGMSPGAREDALAGLVAINRSSPITELVAAMLAVKGDLPAARRAVSGLSKLLLGQPTAELVAGQNDLLKLCASPSPHVQRVGYAGIIAAGAAQQTRQTAESQQQLAAWLEGIALVPNAESRSALHAQVIALIDSGQPVDIRRAAVETLSAIPAEQAATFLRVAALLEDPDLQNAAVRTLLSVPPNRRDAKQSVELIDWLVAYAEQTPAANRTENAFLDAMQLVDQLLAQAPAEIAKAYRGRLRETVVRVVRIHTVEEEMRYDTPYFAVEAGRPVQIVLVNEDLMPHNLVVTTPGALQEVAELGLQTGPDAGLEGKQYVPESDKVLFATHMIGAGATERLTFTAPSEPGEYPYVCTFPRHWMRMYGVMVVVSDLDAWNQSPVEPKDPIGSNRHFVQSWTVDDLQADLEVGLRGRSPELGKRLFIEATCAQCHKAGEQLAGEPQAGSVGPELNQVFSRWKNDKLAVLREILDPAHRIDDKYAVHLVLTLDGDTLSGLVVAEDKDSVSLLDNPEATQPKVVLRDDIEEMVRTSTSMMPKGLLDRFSKDEIFEIVAFLQSVQQ